MAIKPITETLARLRGGLLLDEASEKMAQIVRAVEETGKVGKLTIEITVKKISRSGVLDIADRVKVTIPEEQPLTTLMYSTPEGNLLTEDPTQQKLDLKVTAIKGATDQPLKVIGATND